MTQLESIEHDNKFKGSDLEVNAHKCFAQKQITLL